MQKTVIKTNCSVFLSPVKSSTLQLWQFFLQKQNAVYAKSNKTNTNLIWSFEHATRDTCRSLRNKVFNQRTIHPLVITVNTYM